MGLSHFPPFFRVNGLEVQVNLVTQSHELTLDDTIDLEETQIRNLVSDALEAWNRRDVSAHSRIYAEDTQVTTVSGATASGRRAIDQLYARIFETIFKRPHIYATGVRVRFLKPNLAEVYVRWEMTGALECSKMIRLREGLLHLVVARHGGQWLICELSTRAFAPLRH